MDGIAVLNMYELKEMPIQQPQKRNRPVSLCDQRGIRIDGLIVEVCLNRH